MLFVTSSPRFLSPKRPLRLLSLQNLRFFPKNICLSPKMQTESSTALVLCGKSAEENELARCLKTNDMLKLADGSPVTIYLHSETESIGKDDVFHVNSYMNSLMTSRFGRLLLYSPRLASTHDVVANNFGELPIGSACVADLQFNGRGRAKNVCESPKGCLMFSFTIQMEDGRIVPLVQYIVSLAMTEGINDVCQKKYVLQFDSFHHSKIIFKLTFSRSSDIFTLMSGRQRRPVGMPSLDVRIKWPNDLYLDGLKVGGILCTSTYKSRKFNISAGIGLNIDYKKPTTCLNDALRRLGYTVGQLQREDIVAAFFNKFESFYDIFISQGFQALENLYYKTWLHSGQRVIVLEKNESEDQVSENVVTIQGLTPAGYLFAATDDGQICELHPVGNSFDFFKGLVRRKLS